MFKYFVSINSIIIHNSKVNDFSGKFGKYNLQICQIQTYLYGPNDTKLYYMDKYCNRLTKLKKKTLASMLAHVNCK